MSGPFWQYLPRWFVVRFIPLQVRRDGFVRAAVAAGMREDLARALAENIS